MQITNQVPIAVHVIIKVAIEKTGSGVYATTEAAFKTAEEAGEWLKSRPAVWDEVVQGNECSCERAVHTVTLN